VPLSLVVLKPRSHCVRCRTSTYSARMHVTIHPRVAIHDDVRYYMLLTVIYCLAIRRRYGPQHKATFGANRHKLCGMLRSSTYNNTVCVNAVIEINVLDYNVTVHQLVRASTPVATGLRAAASSWKPRSSQAAR